MSGWRWLPLFITMVLLLLFVVQYYFFLIVKNYLTSTSKNNYLKFGAYAIFICFNIPLFYLLFFRPHIVTVPEWLMYSIVYPFYVWHFSLVLLFILVISYKVLQSPFLLIHAVVKKIRTGVSPAEDSFHQQQTGYHRRRRAILRGGFALVAGAAFTESTLGAFHRDSFEVTHSTVSIKALPEEFEGFTIALISDIHSSVFMQKEKMQDYAAEVNSLKADMVVVPGDFVNSMLEEVYPFAEAFSALSAPYGIYGVLGNHDYFTRRVETVAREVNGCGITLLRNEQITVNKQGHALHLLGIDDTGNTKVASSRVGNIIKTTRVQGPAILLCHRPYFFEQFADLKIDLTLSGHTHGGQIVFGKLDRDVIAPARMVSPYVAGLYTIGNSSMYVSRGIGTVGIPIRLNCPPEITKITLTKS